MPTHLPLTPSVSTTLAIYIKCNSALPKADAHRSKSTGLASFLQQWSSHSLHGIPVRQYMPHCARFLRGFGGRTEHDTILCVICLLFTRSPVGKDAASFTAPAELPLRAPDEFRIGSARVGHAEKGVSVPKWKEKHWRVGKLCKLRAATIHRLGKLCGLYLLHSC